MFEVRSNATLGWLSWAGLGENRITAVSVVGTGSCYWKLEAGSQPPASDPIYPFTSRRWVVVYSLPLWQAIPSTSRILSREYERKGGYHLRNHSRQSALSVPLRCQLRKNAVVAQKLKGRRAGGLLVWSFVVGNVRCCGGGSGSRFSGE